MQHTTVVPGRRHWHKMLACLAFFVMVLTARNIDGPCPGPVKDPPGQPPALSASGDLPGLVRMRLDRIVRGNLGQPVATGVFVLASADPEAVPVQPAASGAASGQEVTIEPQRVSVEASVPVEAAREDGPDALAAQPPRVDPPAAKAAAMAKSLARREAVDKGPVEVAKRPALAQSPPGGGVLVVGDSLSISLGQALEAALKSRGEPRIARRGKVSSGLARPDFFDWEQALDALVAAHAPQTVVIMIAANDNKPVSLPGGGKAVFASPAWDAEYARRVKRLLDIAARGNPEARVFWVGAPVMADPGLSRDVTHVNAVIRTQVEKSPQGRYLDSWRALAGDEGQFRAALATPRGPLALRSPDGVHLAPAGARILADLCLLAM